MKRIIFVCTIFCLAFSLNAFAKGSLLIDDFEGIISGGPTGTVDFGAGNGSSVAVTADSSIKQSGAQSIKVVYDAIAGGYMYVARGTGLDAKNSDWLVKPETIDWKKYGAISFYVYGSDSKTKVAFDIKDSGNEIWRFLFEDNFKGWKQIICPFEQFAARNDWQPDAADKNGALDFPIKSYQFEPLPEAKGTIYFDQVELIEK